MRHGYLDESSIEHSTATDTYWAMYVDEDGGELGWIEREDNLFALMHQFDNKFCEDEYDR